MAENQLDFLEKRVLKSLSMSKTGQLEKTKPILKKNYEASAVGVNEDGFLTIDDRATTIEATNFLYNLRQRKKGLHDPDYKRILEKIDFSPSLVANSDAKLLPSTRSKAIVRLKIKTPGKCERNDWMTSSLQNILKQKRSQREGGKLSDSEKLQLEKLYKKGPAAYASVSNLQKPSSLSRVKVETLPQSISHIRSKDKNRKRFPELKVNVNDINGIWSICLT